jgi:hypothetical protein
MSTGTYQVSILPGTDWEQNNNTGSYDYSTSTWIRTELRRLQSTWIRTDLQSKLSGGRYLYVTAPTGTKKTECARAHSGL